MLALALLGAGWVGSRIVGPAVAIRLADRAVSPADLERAVAWDPASPALRVRVSDAYRAQLGRDGDAPAAAHLGIALRQRPGDALTWLRVAKLKADQGDLVRARAALAVALAADAHHVGLRWEAALLSLRWGDRDGALDHLRYVAGVDPGRREAAMMIARRFDTGLDAELDP